MRPRSTRALCLTLSVLMALPGGGRPDPTQGQDPAEVVKAVNRVIDTTVLAAREMPRDTFDLHDVVDRVGREPGQLFEFVRDHTWWVAYAGSLRGAQGTLMDRLGNSLDRSLLLASLLRVAGHDARLAHATLGAEAAKAALAKVSPPPARRIVRTAEETAKIESALTAVGKQLGITPEAMQKAKEATLREQAALADAATARTRQQVAQLGAVLGDAATAAVAQADRSGDLADHWWVQVESEGKWIDHDALLHEHAPGTKLAEASETIAFTTGKGFVLPTELSHRERIAVRVAVRAGGKVTEATVLDHEFVPAALLGQPIALSFVGLDLPTDGSLFIEKDDDAKTRDALAKQKEWLPSLRIGESWVVQKSFTASGEVVSDPKLDPTARLGAGIGDKIKKIDDLFGALDTPAAPAGELVGIHVDHTLVAPGRDPVTARRTVFALEADKPLDTGAQLLRATKLLTKFNLQPLCCELSPEFVLETAARLMAANKPFLAEVVDASKAGDRARVGKALSKVRPIPGLLPNLALQRHGTSLAEGALVVDRLQLLAEEAAVGYVKDTLVGRVGFDIVANRFGVLPAAASRARELAFAQGVLDTALEALVRDRTKPTENTGELLAASATQKVAWKRITAPDDPLLAKLEPGVASEVRAELASGNVVVAPEKRIECGGKQLYGWWRVDPRSGTTLGIMEGGRGQATVEHVMVIYFVGYAAYVGCTGTGAASDAKRAGCMACAALAMVAAITTLGWAPVAAFGIVGSATTGAGAVLSGIGCSLFGAYAS